jgi:hypothetical protein
MSMGCGNPFDWRRASMHSQDAAGPEPAPVASHGSMMHDAVWASSVEDLGAEISAFSWPATAVK